MGDPTLIQLFTPYTSDDILASMLDVAQRVGLPATAWQPVSVGREVLAICAQEIANYSVIGAAGAAAGGLLDYATGDWLTLLAISNFGVTRIPSSFGTTTVNLSNTSATTYTIAAGDIIFVNERTGQTYTNTTGGVLNANTGTLTLSVIANEAGSVANANPNEITELQTPLLGVTCTNIDPLVGDDEQSDDDLRELCRESMAKASPNGPRDAYSYFAKTATRPDGSNIGITRVRVVQGNGTIDVYLADADGIVSPTDVGYVNTAINANCVPTGFSENTYSANAHNILIAGDAYLVAGSTLTDADAQAAILTQLTTYFKTIPIGGYDIGAGGYVFLDAIIGQVFRATQGELIQFVPSSPTVDEAMNFNDVAILTSVATSFTIHRTS
jgi:phage-related baseplate assembly protein